MHTLQEPAHVLRVNARGDAMPEVGDPCLGSPAFTHERLTHVLDLTFDGIFPSMQDRRVGISLQCDHLCRGGINNTSCFRRLDDPVQPEDVITGVLGLRCERRVGAFCEKNHRHSGDIEPRELRADTGRNVGERREGELVKVVG